MTEQEQRIAIAEACGWSRFGMYSHCASGKQLLGRSDTLHGTPPEDKDKPEDEQAYKPVPDFHNDLNAMHAAELTLDKDSDQLHFFAKHLWQAMQGSQEIYYGTIHSNAAQRAEAFLKCLGKWKD